MTATPQEITAKSVCLVLSFTRVGTRRSVSADQVKVDADKSMVHVSKDLFNSPQLRAIVSHDNATRRWVVSRSVPSPLFRDSVYLLGVDAIEEVCEHLEKRKADRAKLEDVFFEAYPSLVAAAKQPAEDGGLGALFDLSEYPSVGVLRAALGMEWSLIEWGTPERKLSTISQALYEREKAKAEEQWKNAAVQIEDALVVGMQEVFGHLADRLSGGEDGKPKRFKQATVRRVEDFLDLFAKRNLTGREDLAALAEKGRKLLSGVDAAALKSDDVLRARAVIGVGEITKALDGMLEARPRRKIGEEV